jgi:stage III sporulation protein AE
MRIILAIIIYIIVATLPAIAAAAGGDEISKQLVDILSVDEVNRFITRINQELNEDLPLLNSDSIRDVAAKGLSINWESIKTNIIGRLFKELSVNAHLMGKLLFLAVLCALLQNLHSSFDKSAVSLLTYSVCYIFLAVIALTAFYNALTVAQTAVGYMVGFMEAMLPVLVSLLAGIGAVTTAALLTPLMLFVVSTISVIVKDIVLPLLFLSAVLQCVNFLGGKYQISNLAGLFKQGGMVILGLTLVVFVGIITIQGVAGGVADGIALRTAKYATATFIPVIGKMFADTVELVMGASLLLKNAVGVLGIVAVATICVAPLIKLISLVMIMKLAGALVQPMGDEKMAKCLDVMGDNLLLVFGGVLTVALMFFLVITMVIGVGSMTMMLR